MAGVTTMDRLLWPLMDGPSIRSDRCVVCGRRAPLEQHHVVYRSQGELYRDGRRLTKPTLTLCGLGNLQGFPPYCHGLAHARRLHFRFEDGLWQVLYTDVSTRYEAALQMGGWEALPYYRRH